MTATTISDIDRIEARRVSLHRIAISVAVAGVSAALLWFAASAHLRYACVVQDTPYLPLCADPAVEPAQVREELRDRLHRNPGDAWAWSSMVPAAGDEAREAALRAATALAPNNPTVLRWRAASALQGQQLQEGIALLVQLIQHRTSNDAARVLAQLAVLPETQTLLLPHLKEAEQWLPRVIASLQDQKLPPGHALPLIVEAAKQNALPASARRHYMQQLRRSGQWLDAYGLWVAVHKREVPLLYNGSFDQQFVADGFDWEFARMARSRAGVVVEQQSVAKRGLVLSLEFTGRRFAPAILQQHVFTPSGAYRLEGQYMASKLRSEGGLAWSIVCPATNTALPARSDALQDSGGLWRSVEFEFTIPSECGPIARLQLEPVHRYEANTGMRGRVELDGFILKRAE